MCWLRLRYQLTYSIRLYFFPCWFNKVLRMQSIISKWLFWEFVKRIENTLQLITRIISGDRGDQKNYRQAVFQGFSYFIDFWKTIFITPVSASASGKSPVVIRREEFCARCANMGWAAYYLFSARISLSLAYAFLAKVFSMWFLASILFLTLFVCSNETSLETY